MCPDEQPLSPAEKRVLAALLKTGPAQPEAVAAAAGFEQQVEAMSAASWLKAKGLVEISERTVRNYMRDTEGETYAREGLPERRVQKVMLEKGGIMLSRMSSECNLKKGEAEIAIGWLRRKGWAEIAKHDDGPHITITEAGRNAPPGPDEILLNEVLTHPGPEDRCEQRAPGGLALLKQRQNVVKWSDATTRTLALTERGRAAAAQVGEVEEEASLLTPKMLQTGRWKEVRLRPYDINAFAPALFGAKPHPLMELTRRIRRIFLSMGFSEITGNFVENSFWNMDALFIPQDHPARELQDTYYLSSPTRIPVEPGLARKIKTVHEKGGGRAVGSEGWGGRWSIEESEKALLRTHTTVATIRYLSTHPEPPVRVFSVGRVFRRDVVDATHLPEFTQIEGIAMEKGASLRMLVGILRAFYARMGFPEVRIRPAFFPYTEPSLEVEVRFGGKWMELGGAGIFRPEVTLPFGVKHPVLAWGLGLERLAVMLMAATSMRDLYLNDLDWLRKARAV